MAISPTLRLLSASVRATSTIAGSGPIRWGILSAGRISSDYVQAIRVSDGAEAVAIAARSPRTAEKFATQHSISKVFSSYTDLIQSPDIDVVYIGTIADHHVKWTREAILAGKPVVCEKPLALSSVETGKLIDLARERNVFLMEGMWTRCFPAIKKLRQIIADDEIGPIVYIQGDFGYSMANIPSNDRHWMPSSGGITLDIGMYIAQFGSLAFPNGRVKNVHATGNKVNGVDYSVMANVTYERGGSEMADQDGMMQFVLTGAANTEERVVLQGTKGRVVIDGPFHIPQKLRVFHDLGRGHSNETVYDFPLPDDPFGTWNNPGSIGFVHQINEVGKALKKGNTQCDCFTWDDSLEVAQIIDDVLVQVRSEKDVHSLDQATG